MIDVHYWPTPNGWKVTIMLEECGLPYTIVPVDIGGGDQFKPEFLRISPNNRMPAIVDHAPEDGGAPITIFESGAILEYLADKSGRFLSPVPRDRYRVLQWVHWQMANLGPMMGNANHFKNYGKNIAEDPAQLEYGNRPESEGMGGRGRCPTGRRERLEGGQRAEGTAADAGTGESQKGTAVQPDQCIGQGSPGRSRSLRILIRYALII